MAFYDYEALKNGKERVRGKVEANSEKEARDLVRKQDLLPVKVLEIGSVKTIETIAAQNKKNQKKQKKKPKKNIKLKLREKIDFTNILHTFSKSGISLIESLYFIETNSDSKNIRDLAMELRRLILQGTSFSDAVAKMPHIFDDIYSGLVKAGEESGELEETLARVSYILAKQDSLNSKIVSTLAYPVFVLFLALLVSILLITFVFPAFEGMYSQMGTDLPLITTIFMTLGKFLKQNWILIPLLIGSIVYAVYFLITWDISKKILDKIGLNIPVFEKFVRYTSVANFLIVMKVAFEAGITMVDSIMLANLTVRNVVLKEALRKVVVEVQYGKSLSSSLKSSKVMPGIIMCMISTGEESGSLSQTLGQANEYVDAEVDKIVEILSKLFEPFLFVIIGIVVLTLGLSLYLPLFQTYAKMG